MYKVLVFIALILVLNECGKMRAQNRKRKREIKAERILTAENLNCYLTEQRLKQKQKPKQTEPQETIELSEKEKATQEKQKQKLQQAEADKQFLETQLESIGNLILQVDEELNKVNQKISVDIQLKSYDAEQRDRKKREQIIKKLLVLERQQHAAEAKLAKANYIIQENR